MKKLLFLSIIMSFSCVTFAGQSKQNNCVATGVPSKGCICWPDGVCVDVGDIGTHP